MANLNTGKFATMTMGEKSKKIKNKRNDSSGKEADYEYTGADVRTVYTDSACCVL